MVIPYRAASKPDNMYPGYCASPEPSLLTYSNCKEPPTSLKGTGCRKCYCCCRCCKDRQNPQPQERSSIFYHPFFFKLMKKMPLQI